MTGLSPALFGYVILAARWTMLLSAGAFVGGGLLGSVVAVARTANQPVVRRSAALFIHLLQGIPLLIVLFLSYYGLSMLGLQLQPVTAALLSLSLYSASFLGEIWRGCLESVPRTQHEAARSLGLGWFQSLIYVILPQASLLAIAPTVGFLVQIIKNTSLASVIGFVELTRAGQVVNNATFRPLPIFLTIAAVYFALCFPLSLVSRFLERRLEGYRHG